MLLDVGRRKGFGDAAAGDVTDGGAPRGVTASAVDGAVVCKPVYASDRVNPLITFECSALRMRAPGRRRKRGGVGDAMCLLLWWWWCVPCCFAAAL